MRIIAGEFRSRKLLPPPSDATRPVTDRVKQSMFDVLMPFMENAMVLDIFAGTGSMGLEALSRGSRHATFFESDRGALAALRKNIQTLKVENRSRIIAGDVFMWRPAPSDAAIDLAFLDPPYRFLREEIKPLQRFAERLAARLSPQGLVIFRHSTEDALALPPLRVVDVRDYGSMRVELLAVNSPAEILSSENSVPTI